MHERVKKISPKSPFFAHRFERLKAAIQGQNSAETSRQKAQFPVRAVASQR
jgi:hypothetical protein